MREVILGLLCAAAFAVGAAWGDPPPGEPGPYADWFKSLRVPNGTVPCCSVADCRHVQYRTAGDHYEAYVDNATFPGAGDGWIAVPKEAVMPRANPTGEAVMCWWGGQVRCFVPASGV